MAKKLTPTFSADVLDKILEGQDPATGTSMYRFSFLNPA